MPSQSETVKASGGLVWRAAPASIEVLLVHRPHYDDWSFPKGKRDPGEDDLSCALREVREETGFVCRVGDELPSIDYRDAENRMKTVRYWAMEVESGAFGANEEVDTIRWLDFATARRSLTYDRDRDVLASLETLLLERRSR